MVSTEGRNGFMMVTDADLVQLALYATDRGADRAILTQFASFVRLEKAGLVSPVYSISDPGAPIDFTINADGATVVNAMLAAGRMVIDK